MFRRYIGEITRQIYDLIHYTDEYQIPGLLLLVDFEKALQLTDIVDTVDTVDWTFIQKNAFFLWVNLLRNGFPPFIMR